ncbi:DNA polymerase I [Streptomyces sp. AJS327]|uniref:DNA polymerase n=1 Tax=Streptomyces sp. AJS327 TaxID=2545265 RepID=UPI0015DF9D89|nr:DNA polymerase [Streptomyces sp. AJS327]MBA0054317.1 DNA polymerase I [Streptomyces sp. AJS327]
MRTYRGELGGRPWVGYALETTDDIAYAWRWLKDNQPRAMALDTETDGLHTFSGDGLRLVQFGTEDVAFVVPVERGRAFQEFAADIVRKVPELVIHNAAFDLLVLGEHLKVKVEELEGKTVDTKILAHLVDSRQDFEGGVGTSLKPLSAWYIDPAAPDTQSGLTAEFRKIGHTKATGWRHIPYENDTYAEYAALDVILTSRIRPILEAELVKHGIPERLVAYEHRLMAICARIERRGMLLDVEYTEGLVDRLQEDAERHARVAQRYGVENLNSTRQVAEALQGMGETLTETTPSGALAVGKEVLLPLADLDGKWQPMGVRKANPLADAVLRSKRAAKWRKSYAVAMLENRDAEDRVHPKTNTLGAKTGRASVSDPPLQQLPSKGWEIRRCIVADPGELYFSVDQSSVELVVLAALSGDQAMCDAVRSGRNLHDYTATLMFGKDFTEYQRGLAKIGGLGASYQGGPAALSKMTGLPEPEMRDVMRRYMRAYPTLKPWFKGLQRQALANGCEIRTPSGRRLVLDRDRLYKAVAYVCQSTARDTMGQALVDLDDKGLTPYLTSWIHDEVIGTAPESEVGEVAQEVARTVQMELYGVPISTDADVYGKSWANGYKLPPEWHVK